MPGDSSIEDCNTTQISRCSHLHTNFFEAGEITECVENCSHVVDTDTITIDSVLIDTRKRILGRMRKKPRHNRFDQ